MNTTQNEENLVRWLDGEMDEAERERFEAQLEADPVLKSEAMAMKKMTEAVRMHLPEPEDIPHADFFNSQIQREIEQLKVTQQREQTSANEPAVLRWWKLPWIIAASAALVALFALVNPKLSGGVTEIVTKYAPDERVQLTVMQSTEANATVLMLDGLQEIPANTPLVGYRVHRSENDPQMAMTTLFDEKGEVVLVMAQGANGLPKVVTR
ncbi:MAG: hypothetical protein JNJ83_23710 [Verrucomicrobiaceae bacterium]|nr:hypothetical protein [Verrucomicrobiaceae bacterium]